MSKRTRPFRGLFFVVLLLLAPAAGADDTIVDSGTPNANDPLDLSGSVTPARAFTPAVTAPEVAVTPEPGPPASADAAPIERLPGAGTERETETGSAAPGLPPSESMPLGIPAVAAGPAPEGPREAARGEGVLDRLGLPDNEIVRIGGALSVVLGLLLLTRVVLKRAVGAFGGGSRPAGVLEILARYPVARGQTLVILKLARRVVLVHHAGGTMRTLTEVTDPEEVAQLLGRMEAGSRGSESARFAAALRSFEGEHERLSRRSGAGDPRRPGDEVEVVDLTRSQGRGLGGLFARRRLTA